MKKYYLIMSVSGKYERFWNQDAKIFSFSTVATQYKTMDEAQKEVEETASYFKPCHVTEVIEHKNQY